MWRRNGRGGEKKSRRETEVQLEFEFAAEKADDHLRWLAAD